MDVSYSPCLTRSLFYRAYVDSFDIFLKKRYTFRCKDMARGFLSDPDPNASLLLGDVRKIAECFRFMKVSFDLHYWPRCMFCSK